MSLIDLTQAITPGMNGDECCTERLERRLPSGVYHPRIHSFRHSSMAGTYIDFPSHIEETDNGIDAANCAAADLFRIPSSVIRLDRASGSGKIGAAELASAYMGPPETAGLVINALGARAYADVESRSVYLGADAVDWIIEHQVKLLVSDVFESNVDPQEVFVKIFTHGMSAVCGAINLHSLTEAKAMVTVLPLRLAGATQCPCRILAEV